MIYYITYFKNINNFNNINNPAIIRNKDNKPLTQIELLYYIIFYLNIILFN